MPVTGVVNVTLKGLQKIGVFCGFGVYVRHPRRVCLFPLQMVVP